MEKVLQLDDIIYFNIEDQYQINGIRGYVNSYDENYKILRELALPLVSYIYVEKVGSEDNPLFYWKLFVDYEAIAEKQNGPTVFNYGKTKKDKETSKEKSNKKIETIHQARSGQGKYREKLLEQCRFCPFTMIADERLLNASHIKPYAASNDKEKIDPYNGYMLSPLYDKLFDRGFITFTEDRHVILSEVISPFTWRAAKLRPNLFIRPLLMDDKRIEYLKFHQENVFKGSI